MEIPIKTLELTQIVGQPCEFQVFPAAGEEPPSGGPREASAEDHNAVASTATLLADMASTAPGGSIAVQLHCTVQHGQCTILTTSIVKGREKEIRGSGGSLEPPGPLLTHLRTVYMAYSECLPTRLDPPG